MSITLRYAARCEAAGRDHNEDNFLLDYNLNDDQWGFTTDEAITLKGNGSLLLVCDGMGGMNAGEVASAVAVRSIKDWFDSKRLTPSVTASPKSIMEYIHDAIQAADAAIKQDEQQHPEHEGMGSTIVLAWIINGKVYVGWCGDSRAYRFNPKRGLERLSHDHSYVQELVDAGKLSEDLAIDHPNSNIITRSLGDPRGKAQPDVKEFDLYQDDIILLCSDGLCGCLRDNEIETIVSQNQTSMKECRDALWEADKAAGWHDNVTITLAQVTAGGVIAPEKGASISNSKAILIRKNKNLKLALGIIIGLLVIGIGFLCWKLWADKQPAETEIEEVATDSIPSLEVTDQESTVGEPAESVQTPARKPAVVRPQAPKPTPVPVEESPAINDEPTAEEKAPAPRLTPINNETSNDAKEIEETEIGKE